MKKIKRLRWLLQLKSGSLRIFWSDFSTEDSLNKWCCKMMSFRVFQMILSLLFLFKSHVMLHVWEKAFFSLKLEFMFQLNTLSLSFNGHAYFSVWFARLLSLPKALIWKKPLQRGILNPEWLIICNNCDLSCMLCFFITAISIKRN